MSDARILCVYSNPGDTERLRLDREHRHIDEVLERLGKPAGTVERRHASTVQDFVAALGRGNYEVVEISAHGDERALAFEDASGQESVLVEPGRLAHLVATSQPGLKVALFMSCFSASSADALRAAAPYVVLVDGGADDALAIAFVGAFFESYLRSGSIETAYGAAASAVTLWEGTAGEPVLHTRLLRRNEPNGEFTVGALVAGTTFFVDYSGAAAGLDRLGIDPTDFAASVARKIRVHHWMFAGPREDVVLPIGRYVGRFSWQNSFDVIRCTAVDAPRDDLSEEELAALYELIVVYNDLATARYRVLPRPADPENRQLLAIARQRLNDAAGWLTQSGLGGDGSSPEFASVKRLASANMKSNLSMASEKLERNELGDLVYFLEAALTALHDVVTAAVTDLCR